MTAEIDHAQLLHSFIEYKVFYREPIFEVWHRQLGDLTLAIFRAFRDWEVGLENISANQNPSDASEIQINVELLNKKAVFNVGLGASRLSVTDPNWSEMESIVRLAQAGIGAVLSIAAPDLEKQQITLNMHVKPDVSTQKEIGARFLRLDEALFGHDIRAYGFAAYGEDGHWVVDPSGLYRDALFIRLQRSFEVNVTLELVAAMLQEEQGRLLAALGLRIS